MFTKSVRESSYKIKCYKHRSHSYTRIYVTHLTSTNLGYLETYMILAPQFAMLPLSTYLIDQAKVVFSCRSSQNIEFLSETS